MVSREDHEKSARRRWQELKPVLRECIGVEKSPALRLVTYKVLLDLVCTINGREVEIGRGVVFVPIFRIGSE